LGSCPAKEDTPYALSLRNSTFLCRLCRLSHEHDAQAPSDSRRKDRPVIHQPAWPSIFSQQATRNNAAPAACEVGNSARPLSFRASRCTSVLLEDGAIPAVVQKQLRHSDPRTTLGIYGHVICSVKRLKLVLRELNSSRFSRRPSVSLEATGVQLVGPMKIGRGGGDRKQRRVEFQGFVPAGQARHNARLANTEHHD
jgi:hypothetical protein